MIHIRFIYFLFILCLMPVYVKAEIKTDGSVGTCVNVLGPNYNISADIGKQVGGNLFHSFEAFNIDSGESAIFSGHESVERIIGRITGDSPSRINGLIRSSIAGADLFLFNPSGIAFGAGAALDISGSFYASTGDYLEFEDGRFNALLSENSTLSAAPPSAFGFLDENPAPVLMEGCFLKVSNQENITVIGGDIRLHNSALYAESGQINIVSAAVAGTISVDAQNLDVDVFGNITVSSPFGGGLYSAAMPLSNDIYANAPDINSGEIFIRGGKFEIVGGNVFAASGINIEADEDVIIDNSKVVCETSSYADAGDITVWTENLTLTKGGIIGSSTQGDGYGGQIEINAGNLTISGKGIDTPSGIFSTAEGFGDAGYIGIFADTVTIENGGRIENSSFGEGHAGYMEINADILKITGQGSGLFSTAADLGNAGYIGVFTNEVLISDNGRIENSTTGTGIGNYLDIRMKNLNISGGGGIFSATAKDATAGYISITGETVTLTDNGKIESSTSGFGDAGWISIIANSVLISSGARIESSTCDIGYGGYVDIETENLWIAGENSGCFSTASGFGDGGYIGIYADNIELSDKGRIENSTSNIGNGGYLEISAGNVKIGTESGLFSTASGSGDAGYIGVFAGNVSMFNAGRIENAVSGSGSGSHLDLRISQLRLSENASISSQSFGTGDAGNIDIRAEDAVYIKNSTITTAAEKASGGDIFIRAHNLLYMSEGEITATVGGGQGRGGNISVDPGIGELLVILNKSRIIANADRGNGGDIRIVGDQFLATPDSFVKASSNLGIDGTVSIVSPETDIGASLSVLPILFLDPMPILRNLCEMRKGQRSSITDVGSGAQPQEPGGCLY